MGLVQGSGEQSTLFLAFGGLDNGLKYQRLLWERMRALFYTYALESMRQLLEALVYGLKKPQPSFAFDSS